MNGRSIIHDNSTQFTINRMEQIEMGPVSLIEFFVLVRILDIGEENGLTMESLTILHNII